MKFKQSSTFNKKALLFLVLTNISLSAFSQIDSLKKAEPLKASANIQITNNGISLFPNFSLGKPAVILNLSIGKRNIYFEPELRWGLNGQPWSYIYWLRYKYRKTENFGFNFGVHPSYVFKETPVFINGVQENRYISQRYFSGEIVPAYYFSKKFTLGVHYLYSKGLDSYATQNSHFIALQPKFPNITVTKTWFLSLNPQVFYLVLDDKSGTYVSESLSLNKKNLPLNISSIFTYKINSTIPGDDIVWNIAVNYKL